MGFLHAIQGMLVLWLSNDFTLPVVATYMTGPPGLEPPQIQPLFDVSIAWGVALFLFLSALAHFVISAPIVHEWYLRNLAQKRRRGNPRHRLAPGSILATVCRWLTPDQ